METWPAWGNFEDWKTLKSDRSRVACAVGGSPGRVTPYGGTWIAVYLAGSEAKKQGMAR